MLPNIRKTLLPCSKESFEVKKPIRLYLLLSHKFIFGAFHSVFSRMHISLLNTSWRAFIINCGDDPFARKKPWIYLILDALDVPLRQQQQGDREILVSLKVRSTLR